MNTRKKIVRRVFDSEVLKSLESHGLDSLLPRIYASRGVKSVDEVHYTLKNLVSFEKLKGAVEAADLIFKSLEADKSIVILGDYDADGATAVAVMVSAFKMFGVKVNYIVPNRFKEGYGLTSELVDEAHEKYKADVLISVDSGIKDIEGVDYANSLGMQVIITDHHIPDENLPKAAVIVNPNLAINKDFPSKCMAGVGVAFYVMLALRSVLRKKDWFIMRDIADPNMAELLDLVALGTIADVVGLDKNNRLMVYQGLLRIKKDKARVGIRALFSVTQRNISDATSGDLAFAIAPHINAAGRLQDISVGVQLLISNDPVESDKLALQLHDLNVERKKIESLMQQQAVEIVNDYKSQKVDVSSGLCLYKSEWHQGVAGILASRMKEQFACPVIILTSHSETELKGSARSIEGIDVRQIIADIADQYPKIVLKFGGHKTAAGLTIAADGLEVFQQEFSSSCQKLLSRDVVNIILESDGELPANRLTIETAKMLRDAGPWGHEFSEPLFNGCFNIVEQRIVGQRHLKLSLQNINSYEILNAIMFNVDLEKWPNEIADQVNILYRLDVNEFRGFPQLQLIVQHIEPKITQGVDAKLEESSLV